MINAIEILFEILSKNKEYIQNWINNHSQGLILPVYSSHDIRNSGYKVSTVDANAFPAGFNNLCENSLKISSNFLKEYINNYFPDTSNIILLVEEHTRNLYYLENAYALNEIIKSAGFNTVCATLGDSKNELKTASGKDIILYPAVFSGEQITADGFCPEIVISNNDFSSGKPESLFNIKQPVIPLPGMGWYRRRKSEHFKHYCSLAEDIANHYLFDPWLISGYFDWEEDVDFKTGKRFEDVGNKIENILEKIQEKYDEYSINDKPFVFIKNNSGTYGMSVMTAESKKDFVNMNRTTRNKMSYGKNKIKVTSIIIQEGIPTVDMLNGKVAEPLLYFIGDKPVGGFFRFHTLRSAKENLNVRGMLFDYDNLCPLTTGIFSRTGQSNVGLENITIYELIGLLSTLSQAYESRQIAYEEKK